MAYYVGDIPAEDIVIEPARQGVAIDLAPFDEATVVLRDFDGEEVLTSGFLAVIGVDTVTVEWPDDSPFDAAGLYSLVVTLTSSTGPQRERLAPVYLVAQDFDPAWHTLDSARADWPDAPSDDNRLYTLLTVAKNDCIEFGTTITDPLALRMARQTAQLMQTRNLWNAGKVDPASGGFGEDTFVIRPFPLDWQIRQTLRPKRGVPRIG